MNRIYEHLRERFAGPLDEERVWLGEYGGHYGMPSTPDEIEATLDEYAERIESTFNCVAHVERGKKPRFSDEEEEVVCLVVILSRSADRETFEDAMGPVDHRIRDAIHTNE